MEEAFRAILLTNAQVSAIVGTRVDWGSQTQGAGYPSIVLHVIDDFEDATMTGPSGLSQGRVQVDCYAETYGAAKLLSRAVRAVLDGYRGGQFSGIFHAATRDGREGGTNEATRPYRVSLDFFTNWRTA